MINILNPDGTLNDNAGHVSRASTVDEGPRAGGGRPGSAGLARRRSRIARSTWPTPTAEDADRAVPGRPVVRAEMERASAQSAMDAVTDGRVKIIPERYAKSYLDWLGEKRDWPISRQLWWGHRIPIWYCDESRPKTDLQRWRFARPRTTSTSGSCDDRASRTTWLDSAAWRTTCIARRRCRGSKHIGCEQDPDVLDTWFSSALWPHSTLGWPEQTPELDYYYPDQRADHQPRHHHALGRADGAHRPVQRRRGAVPRRLHPSRRSSTATARRCRSRRATASTRST